MSFKNFDFIKQRKKFFILSSVITIAGIIILLVAGLNLGIDFSSGTRVDIQAKHTLTASEIDQKFASIGVKPERTVLSGTNHHRASARFRQKLSQAQILKVKSVFHKAYGEDPSVSAVSPQVGRSLARNAIWSIVLASIGIIIYVTIRFEFLQSIAAIVALLHDAFIIVSVFAILHIEVNIDFIAAVLTIVGYSINDTIVTFDRIRENMRINKKKVKGFDDLKEIVNKSISQTIVRSINTVITVLIAVIALYIFGSSAIATFSLALLIGLIAGAYSSIFIASPLWIIWKSSHLERRRKKLREAKA